MLRLSLILVTIIQIHQTFTAPRYHYYQTELSHRGPRNVHQVVIVPHIHNNMISPNARKKKGPLQLFPVSHQLLLPTQLHVIPATSSVHHSFHTDQHLDNLNYHVIPHTVTHGASNSTHHLVPILIPFHHSLVPVHDLSVIPLHRDVRIEQKLSQYKAAMDKKDDDKNEEMNRFRSFYGGFGTGLFFGGHGAGHGFYAYGK